MMELFSKKVKCQRQKVTLKMFDKVVNTPLKPLILKLYFFFIGVVLERTVNLYFKQNVIYST